MLKSLKMSISGDWLKIILSSFFLGNEINGKRTLLINKVEVM
jgi:hypothetical protein